ncbi:MAG TPA: hypothetical protein VGL39_28115 [Jatrophihabitantaceae bacterium]|jgi:hypothetical protein
MNKKYLVPFLAVLLVLLYVPGAPLSAQHGAHKVGTFLTNTGRGVGHFLDELTS